MTSSAQSGPSLGDTYVRDAYLYGYSADAAYRYLHETTLSKGEPLNRLDYMEKVPDASYTAHPTINNDTLHIMGWLDVAAEPMIFHVPDHDEGRYWLLHVMDMDHYTLMAEGSRTRGTRGGVFMFASERWDGVVPDAIDEVFRSPSDILKVMPRIMVVGKPGDFETAKALQMKWRIEPLSAFAGTAAPAPVERAWPDPETTHWLERVNFVLAQGTMAQADRHWIEPSQDIGLAPGKADFTPEQLEAIARGEKLGMQEIIDRAPEMLDARRLLGTRAQLQDGDRLHFSEGTYLGQWGLPPEESMYFQVRVDTDGQPLTGADGRRYRLHMPDPKVDCFWSWTVYNADDRLMAANPLNRYSRGDRTLVADAEGQYHIELAADCQGKADDPNFLPIPDKPFYLILRQYGPGQSTLDGRYRVPGLERVDQRTT
jgi:Uncharacterized conserved protein